jgi:hypothetical protein
MAALPAPEPSRSSGRRAPSADQSQSTWMHASPGAVHKPQLSLQHTSSIPQNVSPHGSPAIASSATHAHTAGEGSKRRSAAQSISGPTVHAQ